MKGGFKSATISDEARGLMNYSVQKIIDANVDVIVGGCTEVSIGVDPRKIAVPFVDALDLLARKTIACCYDLELKNIKAEIYG
jgi:aspartate racemase